MIKHFFFDPEQPCLWAEAMQPCADPMAEADPDHERAASSGPGLLPSILTLLMGRALLKWHFTPALS